MKTEFTAQQLADPATAVAAQAIRKCVHCGFCTATCPTYVLLGDERDSPRGRIYLMKEMLEKQQRPTPDVVRHIDRCLSCLACTTTCPSGVDYMHLVDHSRAYVEQHYARPVRERFVRWLLAKVLPHRTRFRWALRFGKLAVPFRGALRDMGFNSLAAMLELARSTRAAHAPARNIRSVASPAERERARERAREGAREDFGAEGLFSRGRVLLMQGCAESVVRPEIRAATVRLLTRLGYDVIFARGEGCCGALVHHLGRDDESRHFMKRNVDLWSRTIEEAGGVDAIVITASGCGTTIKDYGFALRSDAAYAERASKLASLAKDISELLTLEDVRAQASTGTLRIAYHPACSLQHGQKIVARPKQLLEAAGFDVRVPLESHLCCGSAGTYNILQSDIAASLGQRKADHLAALEPNVIATGNVGCAVHIGARSRIPVVHTVELLDWATGGPKPAAMHDR